MNNKNIEIDMDMVDKHTGSLIDEIRRLEDYIEELDEQGKTWYFEGDELVIKKGKWVIDRYKKQFKKGSEYE